MVTPVEMDTFSGQEPVNRFCNFWDPFIFGDMRSGENLDIMKAFFPTMIELADTTNPPRSYKEECPYNCDDLPLLNKKFRLIEEYLE